MCFPNGALQQVAPDPYMRVPETPPFSHSGGVLAHRLGPGALRFPWGRPANHVCPAIQRRVCTNVRECRDCRVPRRHMPQSFRVLHPHNRRKQEVDVLISTKSGAWGGPESF